MPRHSARFSHNRVASKPLVMFLFLLLATGGLLAQTATGSTDDQVQQANTELTAGVTAGSRPSARTRALVVARHEHLIEMFTNHPEKARSFALSAATRAALVQAEPSYDAVLEKDVPLTGELTSSVADDFVHHTSTKHYSLHTWTGDRGLSFTATRPDIDRLVHHKVTITGLSLPEVAVAETVREATPAEAQTESVSRTAVVAPQAATPAATLPFTGSGVPSGAATPLNSPLGNQTVAVLILKFASSKLVYPPGGFDTQAFWNQDWNGPATPNVNEFTREVSYNQTSASADVYGPITVPGNYTCNTVDAMATAALTTAVASGLDTSKYNHYAYVFPSQDCYFGGLATTDQAPDAQVSHHYNNIWIPIEQVVVASDATTNFEWAAASQHEFGHNLGLSHSNSLDFGALSLGPLDFVSINPGTVTPADSVPTSTPPTPAGLVTAVNTEYGDDFADMGTFQGRYNGNHASQILGWISGSSVQDVTASGSFTIAPVEVNTGLRTLHVLRDPASSSWIWVEYHQPIGIYTPRSEAANPLDVTPNNLYAGAQLHYQDGFRNDGHTFLLDMTPVSVPNKFDDGVLASGKSWSDPYSLLTITTGTQNATSLGVTVSYDTPCATVGLDTATIPASGATGTVTITAPASCNWSVSSNAPWISFPGPVTGTGNGSVQFKSTANTGSTQRNSYITAQRQSLPIVQLGSAVTILPRTVVTAKAGAFVPLVFNVTDNLGINDLSELDLAIKGGTQPDCAISTASGSNDNTNPPTNVYLYLSTNGANNPLGMATGVPGTLGNTACTIDLGSSSWTVNGKNAVLTLMVSFPATYVGVHPVTGLAYGSTTGMTVPLSYVNVTTANTPNVLISPNTSAAPLTGSADSTVPFTITGTNTNFTAASALTVGGAGIAAKNVKVVNAHTITGNMVVKPTAKTGERPVTITTGSEVTNTTFTVTSAAPAIALSPAFGAKGSKVAVTIMGTNTNFTAASTVTASGTRFAVNKVTFVSATELTAEFVLDADTESDPRTITVTSGGEVDTTTFTVNPAVIPEISLSPATGNQGDFTTVTINGLNTNFTDASKITIPGTDIKVTQVVVENAATITAKFTMTAAATAGARVVTVTSGTEVVKGTFTVTAMADTTTTITAAAASVEETAPAMLTVMVAPKAGSGVPTGYVSIIETGKANGLEDIVGTVQLSGGKATLPVSNLTVGDHSFSAQYLGDNTSFALSKSTADVKVTVTADPGKAELATTATLQMLSDGRYEVIVTIANSGKGTAKKVTMTSATLGGTASSQDASGPLPDIAPAGATTALFDFPASAGAPGATSVLKFAGTYTGGNFSGSTRITLPSAPATN